MAPLSFLACGALGLLLRGFQLLQQTIQAQEGGLPELAIALQPSGDFDQRLGLEPAGTALRVAAARNQTRALEHLMML